MTARTHIRGLIVDSKPDKNAVLVMQPDGSVSIVKSDDKKFRLLLNGGGMKQGNWFCCSGEADVSGKAATFSAMADVSPGDEMTTEIGGVGVICWNCHCGGVYETGWCFSASRRRWERIVDIYGQAIGKLAAQEMQARRAH